MTESPRTTGLRHNAPAPDDLSSDVHVDVRLPRRLWREAVGPGLYVTIFMSSIVAILVCIQLPGLVGSNVTACATSLCALVPPVLYLVRQRGVVGVVQVSPNEASFQFWPWPRHALRREEISSVVIRDATDRVGRPAAELEVGLRHGARLLLGRYEHVFAVRECARALRGQLDRGRGHPSVALSDAFEAIELAPLETSPRVSFDSGHYPIDARSHSLRKAALLSLAIATCSVAWIALIVAVVTRSRPASVSASVLAVLAALGALLVLHLAWTYCSLRLEIATRHTVGRTADEVEIVATRGARLVARYRLRPRDITYITWETPMHRHLANGARVLTVQTTAGANIRLCPGRSHGCLRDCTEVLRPLPD